MKTWLLIAWAIWSVIQATDAPPRVIVGTPWLLESLVYVGRVQEALCKKLEIPEDRCSQELQAELLHVRRFVDNICDKKPEAERDPCVNEGVEWILDNRVIPAKIKLLNTKITKI